MLTIWRLVCGLGIVALALVQLLSVADATETSERRVALVIGNSNYRTVPPLPNPRNDAEDVAAALQADGFEVISRQDLDRRGMGEALGRFAREAEPRTSRSSTMPATASSFGARTSSCRGRLTC